MEMWDLYDVQRKPLGRQHRRGEPMPAGAYHLGVFIWVMDSRQRFLVTKRAPEKHWSPGLWENPGGAVQAGESSRAAAVRELFEETGILSSEEELILIRQSRYGEVLGDAYLLQRDVFREQIVLQAGETVDALLVSIGELEELIGQGRVIAPLAKGMDMIKAIARGDIPKNAKR